MLTLPQLADHDLSFPAVEEALSEPDGLLAYGGDLQSARLLAAYRQGIFPWFAEDEPILWWSPATRATLSVGDIHISKSMRKFIRKTAWHIRINHQFADIMQACAEVNRPQQADQYATWINHDMLIAYCELHQLGYAHSIEVWDNDQLVGGLYGVNIGGVFCGESMFHYQSNASKLAFIVLCYHFGKYGGQLIDCQMPTEHLQTLGVRPCSRTAFLAEINDLKALSLPVQCWQKQTIIPQVLL